MSLETSYRGASSGFGGTGSAAPLHNSNNHHDWSANEKHAFRLVVVIIESFFTIKKLSWHTEKPMTKRIITD